MELILRYVQATTGVVISENYYRLFSGPEIHRPGRRAIIPRYGRWTQQFKKKIDRSEYARNFLEIKRLERIYTTRKRIENLYLHVG